MNEDMETLITREDFMVGFLEPDQEEYGCLSNRYIAPFVLAGNSYNSVEQYLMYQKAITFRRYAIARHIMELTDPTEINETANKDHMPLKEDELKIWRAIRVAVAKRGIRAKFLQNQDIIGNLIKTENLVIAHCTKESKIWGIGVDIDDPKRLDADAWEGDNYLGRILMSLRQEFRMNMLVSRDYSLSFVDAMELKPIDEWQLKAGELKMHPAYYKSIHAYADTLISDESRESFYNTSLYDIETVIVTNLGGGYPVAGFFELKQDIYDITFNLKKYA